MECMKLCTVGFIINNITKNIFSIFVIFCTLFFMNPVTLFLGIYFLCFLLRTFIMVIVFFFVKLLEYFMDWEYSRHILWVPFLYTSSLHSILLNSCGKKACFLKKITKFVKKDAFFCKKITKFVKKCFFVHAPLFLYMCLFCTNFQKRV